MIADPCSIAAARRQALQQRLLVVYSVLIPVIVVSLFVLHGPIRFGLGCALLSALLGVTTLLMQRRQQRRT